MDSKEIYSLVRRNIVPICLGVVGLLLLLIGVFQLISHKSQPEPAITFQQNKAPEVKSEIIVDVEGAVMTPGVYKMDSNGRMVDALAKAGGLAEDADRDYVEKNVNLAGKLSDGLKIYIPRTGEQVLTGSNTSASSGEVQSGSTININSASVSELNSLPGVGDVTSQKIIEGRPYASIDELVNKKVIGNATYEKIKDKISAN